MDGLIIEDQKINKHMKTKRREKMKKKKWTAAILSVLTVAGMIFQAPAVHAAGAEEGRAGEQAVGTTYYVSSLKGNDANSGTEENTPFKSLDKINEISLQPGDQVLLEKGSVFNDQFLHIQGSGSEEAPIIISTYGEGERPQINANGKGVWYQDFGKPLDNTQHKYRGNVSSAVLLKDVEYIEIRGLEITNDRESGIDPADTGLEWNDLNVMDRTGVAGITQNIGTADHIVLDDLYIHDIDGNVYNKHMLNGGIYFIVALPENEAATGISRYNDLQITNCHVERTDRWGIAAAYTAYWDQFQSAQISDEVAAKYGSGNVVIRNNYIKDVGGDAITTMYCDRPLVENNVSDGAARHINPTDYKDTNFGIVAAGVWPWKCKNAVFQYNEVYNTCSNQDGQAWDADWGDGTLYQYNYSHNNTGGSVMFCGVQAVNNTFRYNISYLDLAGLNPAGNPDAHVYNNVFYMPEGVDFIRSGMSGGYMTLENNIIYNAGETPKTETWFKESSNQKFLYDNNLYYNYSNMPSNEANGVTAANGTPLFGDLASAPTGTLGVLNPHSDPSAKTVFDGFKPVSGSPAINAGKVITDANGFEVEKDFFGNPLTAVPEIGAAESTEVSLVLRSSVYTVTDSEISGLRANTTIETFLGNLIYDSGVTVKVSDSDGNGIAPGGIVRGGMTVTLSYNGQEKQYSILANGDNEVKDTVYMTDEADKRIYVPFTDKNPTTVSELISNISVHETAAITVLSGDAELSGTDTLANGMLLRVTAENGSTNDYTITQKNEYHWALDYAGPRQGNVWFGQMRTGTGEWTNITAYDNTFPNWQLNQHYGPGVDAPSHEAAITEETHGLLSAPPNTDITTAMTFRAPKTGTVSFAVKDDEPYLRQTGNTGGTVTLSLLVNGEEKQAVTLAESMVKATDWLGFDAIEVNKGDHIRVAARSNDNPTKPSLHVTPVITYQDVAVADTIPPSKPGSVTVSDITHNSAVVMWTEASDNVGVTGYNVYLNGSKVNEAPITVSQVTAVSRTGASQAAGLRYELTGLQAGTAYEATVEAVDAQGNAALSDVVPFTTTEEPIGPNPENPAPEMPGSLNTVQATSDSISISWSPAGNSTAAGYNIYVNGQRVNTALVTGTEYVITGLAANTTYEIGVRAVDAQGAESQPVVLTASTAAAPTSGGTQNPPTGPAGNAGTGAGNPAGSQNMAGTSAAGSSGTAVNTGDISAPALWGALAFLCAMVIMAAGLIKRKI